MTAPSLEALRDIHLPPPPALAFLPEPGWWAAGAALAVLIIGARGIRRHLRRRPLRAAMAEISRLATGYRRDGDGTRLAGGLSRLLRHYALERYPDSGIAGLAGPDWLAFLDARGGGDAFRAGPGAVLEWAPYSPGGQIDGEALVSLVRRWLEANAP